MKISILVLMIFLNLSFQILCDPYIPKQFPTYKQCDKRWGSNQMGSNGDTICQVGCLMSSISEALFGYDILINGQQSNPETFNGWLKQHGGYTSGSDLIEWDVPKLNSRIQYIGKLDNISMSDIISKINTPGTVMIAWVRNYTHFVLATGYDEKQNLIYINDSAFSNAYYELDQIVGWREFTISNQIQYEILKEKLLKFLQ